MQPFAAPVAEYRPAGHEGQLLAEAPEYCPAGQAIFALEPGQELPAGHAEQKPALAPEYCPGEQPSHFVGTVDTKGIKGGSVNQQ